MIFMKFINICRINFASEFKILVGFLLLLFTSANQDFLSAWLTLVQLLCLLRNSKTSILIALVGTIEKVSNFHQKQKVTKSVTKSEPLYSINL